MVVNIRSLLSQSERTHQWIDRHHGGDGGGKSRRIGRSGISRGPHSRAASGAGRRRASQARHHNPNVKIHKPSFRSRTVGKSRQGPQRRTSRLKHSNNNNSSCSFPLPRRSPNGTFVVSSRSTHSSSREAYAKTSGSSYPYRLRNKNYYKDDTAPPFRADQRNTAWWCSRRPSTTSPHAGSTSRHYSSYCRQGYYRRVVPAYAPVPAHPGPSLQQKPVPRDFVYRPSAPCILDPVTGTASPLAEDEKKKDTAPQSCFSQRYYYASPQFEDNTSTSTSAYSSNISKQSFVLSPTSPTDYIPRSLEPSLKAELQGQLRRALQLEELRRHYRSQTLPKYF